MILSLMYKLTPEQCRFIMIDPKMLELSIYEGIPHLLSPVVTDPKKAVNALKWTVREMESRYEMMSKANVRNLAGFNAKAKEYRENGEILSRKVQTGFDENGKPIHETEILPTDSIPNIVVVIDEMADLMMVAGKEIEGCIQRLAQMARAAGIHLITATQRPSVDVITGLIKANVPARVAYAVSSMQDSRVILGAPGAERLVGKGDMLFLDPSSSTPMRLQGAWVEESEVKKIVDHWRQQSYDEIQSDGAVLAGDTPTAPTDVDLGDAPPTGASMPAMPVASAPPADDSITADRPATEDVDELFWQACDLVVSSGLGSTSMLQRKLRVGFSRAGPSWTNLNNRASLAQVRARRPVRSL